MSDVVLTTGITGLTAVLSGFLGYGAARGQLLVESRRLDHEIQKSSIVQQEKRRDLYLEYMAVIDSSWKVTRRPERLSHEEIERWWDAYNEVDNRVELLGSDRVHKATYPLWKVVASLRGALQEAGQDELNEVAEKTWQKISDAYSETRDALVRAMREDMKAAKLVPPQ